MIDDLSEKNVKLIREGAYLYQVRGGVESILIFVNDPNFCGFWDRTNQLFLSAVYLAADRLKETALDNITAGVVDS